MRFLMSCIDTDNRTLAFVVKTTLANPPLAYSPSAKAFVTFTPYSPPANPTPNPVPPPDILIPFQRQPSPLQNYLETRLDNVPDPSGGESYIVVAYDLTSGVPSLAQPAESSKSMSITFAVN